MKKINQRKKINKQKKVALYPPPMQNAQLSHSAILRFYNTGAGTILTVTQQNLLDAILVANTGILGQQLFDLCKIRKIKMWVPAISGANPLQQASLRFGGAIGSNNSGLGDGSTHICDSLSPNSPGRIVARPKPTSPAGSWFGTGAGSLFAIVGPAGTIIDIHLSFKNIAGTLGTSVQNALVGANIGAVYFRGLDGLGVSTTNWPPPVGVAVI